MTLWLMSGVLQTGPQLDPAAEVWGAAAGFTAHDTDLWGIADHCTA